MRGRGVGSARSTGWSRLIATALSLALISAWPFAGAGWEGGDHRVAMSLAVQVDASATLIVGASPEGRIWPGGINVGRPHS